MKIIYEAIDGTQFSAEEFCRNYERTLQAKHDNIMVAMVLHDVNTYECPERLINHFYPLGTIRNFSFEATAKNGYCWDAIYFPDSESVEWFNETYATNFTVEGLYLRKPTNDWISYNAYLEVLETKIETYTSIKNNLIKLKDHLDNI